MDIESDAQVVNRHVLRVLFIEDDDIDARIVALFSNLMETYEFELNRVNSIFDARRALEDSEFDVCLLDYWIGHENSLKILTALEQKIPKVPTIVLSNISRMDVETLRLQSGGTCFLSKGSCTPKTLEHAVRKALQADMSSFN